DDIEYLFLPVIFLRPINGNHGCPPSLAVSASISLAQQSQQSPPPSERGDCSTKRRGRSRCTACLLSRHGRNETPFDYRWRARRSACPGFLRPAQRGCAPPWLCRRRRRAWSPSRQSVPMNLGRHHSRPFPRLRPVADTPLRNARASIAASSQRSASSGLCRILCAFRCCLTASKTCSDNENPPWWVLVQETVVLVPLSTVMSRELLTQSQQSSAPRNP